MVPLAWNQLPSITLADKQRIIGASPPVPPSKVFDTDLGCPLCWQEVKSKDLWLALMEATNADYVVDLGAGSGITARACLAFGIPWVGLCWNVEGRGQEGQGQVVRRPRTCWCLDARLTRGTLASRRARAEKHALCRELVKRPQTYKNIHHHHRLP